jgi:hypothetical protein
VAAQRNVILEQAIESYRIVQNKSGQRKEQTMSLNDLEFAYAPVRDQVRDLREYL